MKSLLILRDPRDVVVPHARYIAATKKNRLYESYQRLSEADAIMTSINGIQASVNGTHLLNIRERCLNVMPWSSQSCNYTTYFERLVGPNGGGTAEAQIQELKRIAAHLGIWYVPSQLKQNARQIFGGTKTFNKGRIGNWRLYFTEEHKRAFKEIAGETLIELGYESNTTW